MSETLRKSLVIVLLTSRENPVEVVPTRTLALPGPSPKTGRLRGPTLRTSVRRPTEVTDGGPYRVSSFVNESRVHTQPSRQSTRRPEPPRLT